MSRKPDVLRLDGIAGISSGLVILALASVIVKTHLWPAGFVSIHVAASMIYGLFSLTLSFQRARPICLIRLIAIANCAWAVLCGGLAVYWFSSLSFLGVGHLLLEMLFVGALGCYEWKRQDELR